MIRTQIYLTEEEQEELDAIATETGRKKSELIRAAVDEYLGKHKSEHWKEKLLKVAGLWKNRDDLPDFEAIRTEMDRGH